MSRKKFNKVAEKKKQIRKCPQVKEHKTIATMIIIRIRNGHNEQQHRKTTEMLLKQNKQKSCKAPQPP